MIRSTAAAAAATTTTAFVLEVFGVMERCSLSYGSFVVWLVQSFVRSFVTVHGSSQASGCCCKCRWSVSVSIYQRVTAEPNLL